MGVFMGKRSGERIGPLSLIQTKRLSNVFAFRAGVWAPPQQHGPPPGPFRGPPPQQGMYGPGGPANGPPGLRDGPPNSLYRPPYRFTETVLVNIPIASNLYHVKTRFTV